MAWKPILPYPSLTASVAVNPIQRRIVGYTQEKGGATHSPTPQQTTYPTLLPPTPSETDLVNNTSRVLWGSWGGNRPAVRGAGARLEPFWCRLYWSIGVGRGLNGCHYTIEYHNNKYGMRDEYPRHRGGRVYRLSCGSAT